jgi:hypothetical protein
VLALFERGKCEGALQVPPLGLQSIEGYTAKGFSRYRLSVAAPRLRLPAQEGPDLEPVDSSGGEKGERKAATALRLTGAPDQRLMPTPESSRGPAPELRRIPGA